MQIIWTGQDCFRLLYSVEWLLGGAVWLWNPPQLLCTVLCNLFWINVDSCKQKAQEPRSEGQRQTFHPKAEAELWAGRQEKSMNGRCSLTRSSCSTWETQNSFHSTTTCFKTIKTNKAFPYWTKCWSFFPPIQEKKPAVLLFRKCAKQNWSDVSIRLLFLKFGTFLLGLSWRSSVFALTSLVLLRRRVEQLFNIYNVWSANHLTVLWADKE